MARSGRPPKIDPLKPIHRAVIDGNVSDFSVELANHEDNINLPGPEGMTPLHIAADFGRVEFAKALLDAGAYIDPINVFGNTPLWVAVMKRRRTCPDGSMIRLLLQHGADPDRGEGETAPLALSKGIAGFPEELIALLEKKSTAD
jgi:ankyrin repeat protein